MFSTNLEASFCLCSFKLVRKCNSSSDSASSCSMDDVSSSEVTSFSPLSTSDSRMFLFHINSKDGIVQAVHVCINPKRAGKLDILD